MKKSAFTAAALAALLACSPLAADDEQQSMTDADKAMYEEMMDNNPAEIFVEEGLEKLEDLVGGEAGLAKFLGVGEDELPATIATFPRYVEKIGMVVGLDQLVEAAAAAHGKKAPEIGGGGMTAIVAGVKSLANGEKINLDLNDKHTKEYLALGSKVFHTRRGGRGLSCFNCHSEVTIGQRLRMQILPNLGAPETKAAATWPAYRMTKSKMVTLQNRFRGCMNNSLQAKLPEGSKEMVALEMYVTSLAQGLEVSIPGLKR